MNKWKKRETIVSTNPERKKKLIFLFEPVLVSDDVNNKMEMKRKLRLLLSLLLLL